MKMNTYYVVVKNQINIFNVSIIRILELAV